MFCFQINLYRLLFFICKTPLLGSLLWLFLLGNCFTNRAEAQTFWDSLTLAPARPRVLVELFTSQSCSSCPTADRTLARLFYEQPLKNVKIIALGQHVDYWNYLSWRDTFSSPLFSKRQKEYARYFGTRQIYTPQMIVDGTYEFPGHRYGKALELIRYAAERAEELKIRSCSLKLKGKGQLSIFVQAKAHKRLEKFSLYFALAQKRLSTKIRNGENAGKNLHYSSVVRYLKRISRFEASALESQELRFHHKFSPKARWNRKRLMYLSFAQSRINGRILGSRECFFKKSRL